MSTSTVSRLLTDLQYIEERLISLIESIPVHPTAPTTGKVRAIRPYFYFSKLTSEQQSAVLEIKRDYEQWIERVRLLYSNGPDKMLYDLDNADKAIREWIEFSSNWSLKGDVRINVQTMQACIGQFKDLLAIFDNSQAKLYVIPDTNSLLQTCDPTEYRSVVGHDDFTFVLFPTVLQELDELKILHRNPDVREKANKSITRIKGWRNQGPLLRGITVDRTIVVNAIAEEPRVEQTLSWLDPTNRDDRLIASVLQFQAKVPNAQVVLITGDINLQNKADAAAIETNELPPP